MVIFVHVPKTAGMSFCGVLQAVYGDVALPDRYGVEDPRYDCGTSHFWADREGCKRRWREQLRAAHVTAPALRAHVPVDWWEGFFTQAVRVTWLRDPVRRAVSQYFYHPWYNGLDVDPLALIDWPQFQNEMVLFTGGDLGQFDFVGLVERFEEDLARLGRLLGWPAVPAPPRVNTSPDPEGVRAALADKALVAGIERVNREDVALYQEALARREETL
jgi:hypothetical protein